MWNAKLFLEQLERQDLISREVIESTSANGKRISKKGCITEGDMYKIIDDLLFTIRPLLESVEPIANFRKIAEQLSNESSSSLQVADMLYTICDFLVWFRDSVCSAKIKGV